MIQRIQTIYLLLVVVLSGVLFFTPVAGWLIDDVTRAELMFSGVWLGDVRHGDATVWALSVLTALIPAVALGSIFMYKKRILQVRMTVFNILLMLGYYGMLALTLWTGGQQVGASDWYLEIVASFPLVNVVLSVMAMRAILKDEALVRSLNRIR